jgi:hypothetical protein
VGLARDRSGDLVDVEEPSTTRPRYGYVFHGRQLGLSLGRDCSASSLFSLVLAPHFQSRYLTNVAAPPGPHLVRFTEIEEHGPGSSPGCRNNRLVDCFRAKQTVCAQHYTFHGQLSGGGSPRPYQSLARRRVQRSREDRRLRLRKIWLGHRSRGKQGRTLATACRKVRAY